MTPCVEHSLEMIVTITVMCDHLTQPVLQRSYWNQIKPCFPNLTICAIIFNPHAVLEVHRLNLVRRLCYIFYSKVV